MTQDSGTLGSGEAQKQPYTAPKLKVFGRAVELTAAGSGDACESGARYLGYSPWCGWPYNEPEDLTNSAKRP